MATITRGYTFGATEQVTNTKLHTLVDSATLSGLSQSDLGAGVGTVSRGTTAPSDSDQIWIDTNFTPPLLKINDGTNWVPLPEYNILTNKTGQSASLGHVCIIDTASSEGFKFTSTAGDSKFRGIVMETIANNASGVVRGYGYFPSILLEISASAGCFLRTSTATGKAEPVAAGTGGVFGYVTTSGTASAGAFVFNGATHGLDTSLAYNWTGVHTHSASAFFASAVTFAGTVKGIFEAVAGSFTGDGNDNRNITAGFTDTSRTPVSVIIKGKTGATNAWWRVSSNSGDESQALADSNAAANGIQSFTTNGFQVGTLSNVNGAGVSYVFLAEG